MVDEDLVNRRFTRTGATRVGSTDVTEDPR
jgi:hypothetical protein